MKKIFIYMAVTGCLSCGTNKTPEAKENTPEEGTANPFPVALFFRQQIHEVDSLKLPTVKYSSENNQTDTVSISLDEFKLLAKDFIESDITLPSLSNQYKETSFADQSVPSITLNYTTDKADLPVQRMDVIINPDPVMDDKVKTIYIEKNERHNDTFIHKKLYWKSHKNFQIITTKKAGNNPEIVSQLKVAWDNSDQY